MRRCRVRSFPMPTWKVTASHDARPAPQANAEGAYNFIGNAAGALSFLGWTTGVPQQAGMWFQIELPAARDADRDPVHVVDCRRRPRRRPGLDVPAPLPGAGVERRHHVERAGRRRRGRAGHDVITFAPVSAKFVRITQTATVTDAPPWSMRLLRLYQAPQ